MNYTNLEIRNGNEYRMLINERIYDKSMFFYPVFKKSVEILDEICSHDRENGNEHFALYYPNNIIMYCAERGGGKSSAMISFAAALKSIKNDAEDNIREFYELWGDIPAKYAFTVLDVVDPTTIFEKEIFMRIILSKMFSEIRTLWKQQDEESVNDYCNASERSNILLKFRKCYGLVDTIYQHCGEFDGCDDLEELADLGDSTNLKKEFKNLVDCFLKQFNGKSEKSYLVIQIDDADLNAKMAYQIIEDIRKYCIIPNVIVLMAVNMKQMHQIIEQHFVKDFETLLKVAHNLDDPISLDDTKDMAARYINKLMPSTHQIHLPKIADFIRNNNSALKLSYVKKMHGEYKDLLSYCDDGLVDSVIDYQERLIRLIYRKTGVRLVKTNDYLHNFLPQNMRELSHFLSYFCNMPDIDNRIGFAELFAILVKNCQIDGITTEQAEKEIKKRKSNIEALEQYLVKFWSDINLSRKDENMISDLSDTVETLKISSAIKMCEDWKDIVSESFDRDGCPSICENSYANLMDKLTRISKNAMKCANFDEIYRMIYALRLLFTIFLHKESLICISTKNFERLYRVVNGELWTCSNLPETKSMGRFEVNCHVLTKLNPTILPSSEKGSIAEDSEALIECCYLRIESSNHSINLKDPEVLRALNKMEEGNSQDIMIYDTGVSLLNILINEKYYSDNDNYTDRVRANTIYDLMMNWDVQHYVEKSLKGFEYSGSVEWRKNYFNKVKDALNSIGLCQREQFELSTIPSDIARAICLSNRDIAIQTVKREISNMRDAVSSLPSDVEPLTKENIAEIADFRFLRLGKVNESFDELRPLEAISDTVRTMSKNKELFKNTFETNDIKMDSTQSLSENEIKVKMVELVKEEIRINPSKFLSAIKRWKEYINGTELIDNIITEIDKEFNISN